MFQMLREKFKGMKEGKQIAYPMDVRPSKKEAKEIAHSMGVNDYLICPNRREAQRIYGFLKRRADCDIITRSVMHNGKEAIKVWRIR